LREPLVSVIIPVYNVEPYLRECLDSVLSQRYPSIEIIAINDGSTDMSPAILEEYKEKYKNLIVIHQENAGNSAARNRGMDAARGKYLYFLDADDYILPETLENIVPVMEEQELDIVRFSANPFFDGIDPRNLNPNVYDCSRFFEARKVYGRKEFLQANIRGFLPSPCLYVLRRELVIGKNIRFQPDLPYEDELFTLLVFLHTRRAMYDPHFYYRRRYRPGSLMTSQNREEKKAFDGYYRLIQELGKLLPAHSDRFERKLIKSRIRSIYISLTLKNIDPQYKRKKLAALSELSKWEKIYYPALYHGKELVKRVLRYHRGDI